MIVNAQQVLGALDKNEAAQCMGINAWPVLSCSEYERLFLPNFKPILNLPIRDGSYFPSSRANYKRCAYQRSSRKCFQR